MAESIVFVCEACGYHAEAPAEVGALRERPTGSLCTACLEELVAPVRLIAREPRPRF
jgi:hypothetical protein